MTREKAIDLVKNDIQECDPKELTLISEYVAIRNPFNKWEVTCKYRKTIVTPFGQLIDCVTYIVSDDGTVLVLPE